MHTCTRLRARARTHSHTHSRFSAKSSGLSYAVDSSGGRTGDRATRHRRDRRCTPRCSAPVPTQPCTTTAIRHTTCKIEADRAVPKLARNSWRPSAVHGIVGGPVQYTDSTVVPPGSAGACFPKAIGNHCGHHSEAGAAGGWKDTWGTLGVLQQARARPAQLADGRAQAP